MKEIKFRQPRLNINGEFIDWFYWGFTDQGGFTAPLKHHLPNYQYTGLLDKNGAEIYDGDIVRRAGTYQIKWSDKRLCFVCENERSRFELSKYTNAENFYEVIGNIYQNPELL